jgi:hypothetical protein
MGHRPAGSYHSPGEKGLPCTGGVQGQTVTECPMVVGGMVSAVQVGEAKLRGVQ